MRQGGRVVGGSRVKPKIGSESRVTLEVVGKGALPQASAHVVELDGNRDGVRKRRAIDCQRVADQCFHCRRIAKTGDTAPKGRVESNIGVCRNRTRNRKRESPEGTSNAPHTGVSSEFHTILRLQGCKLL